MRLVAHKKYRGWGNCIIHMVKFQRMYGGNYWVTWKRGKYVPTFRVRLGDHYYGYKKTSHHKQALFFKGETVEIPKRVNHRV